MSRLTASLIVLVATLRSAAGAAQCVDYSTYLHWAGSVPYPGGIPQGIAGDVVRAYVADGTNGLAIMDITNSSLPVYLETLDTPGTCYDVRIVGDYVLVADGTNGLLTVDPGPPAAIVHTFPVGFIRKLDVDGNVAACSGSSLMMIDVSDPMSLVTMPTSSSRTTVSTPD